MKRLTIEDIRPYFKEINYELLSKYKNNKTKLKIKCDKGHIYKATWNDFWKGARCPKCSGKQKLTIEDIRPYFKEINYELLSKYINAHTKLKIKCDKGHIYKATWNGFQKGSRCPKCSGNQKLTTEDIIPYFKEINYELLSKYKNSRTKLKIKCDKGHIYKATWSNFRQARRCPKCYAESETSNKEIDYRNCVKMTTETEIICNDREVLINPETGRGIELDMLFPEIKKAIEFNGEFWHSENFPETLKKDKLKKELCKKLGIDLLVIPEKLWDLNKAHCLRITEKHLGI